MVHQGSLTISKEKSKKSKATNDIAKLNKKKDTFLLLLKYAEIFSTLKIDCKIKPLSV